jgi:hypothetical protein
MAVRFNFHERRPCALALRDSLAVAVAATQRTFADTTYPADSAGKAPGPGKSIFMFVAFLSPRNHR